MNEIIEQNGPEKRHEGVEDTKTSTMFFIKIDETAPGKKFNTVFDTLSTKWKVSCDMAK